ncbi:MAG TPA: hypothetical protein PKX48_10955 [Planctomycetota bacterium]|jgi:hypothetical protein|nr:hypothetical protein [Planctomycetota bacterium]OQC20659.1 MAG: hypothetical protein BWX69_01689 [Planctomycetes bacterium ADurb.Bin069]NMD35678.1 hypothetical protein [Planctomycetota bacterium]HNR98783.1 hypothetical protein [Planctomycetota bacterium]HNU25491.1 hypothetical protein [Planctomycetota bacterium]
MERPHGYPRRELRFSRGPVPAHDQRPQHGRFPPRAHQRQPAARNNPGLMALAVVGVALLLGMIIIVAGRVNRRPTDDAALPPSAQDTLDPQAVLARDIAGLRLLTGSYEDRIRRVDMVKPRATKASDRTAIAQIRLGFLIEKEKEDLAALRALKPSIAALMDKGDFAGAAELIDKFEKDHGFILKGAAGTVRNLAGEVEALRAEVARSLEATFQKDVALLKSAAAADDLAGGSAILERILTYGDERMKSEARAEWEKADASYAKLRQKELARLTANEARVQAPAAPSPPSGAAKPPEPDEAELAPDPEPPAPPTDAAADDFFGGGAKPAGDVKAFTQVASNRDGTFTATIERHKVTLVFASTSLVCVDAPIQPKKYAEHMVAELPVLFYCEAKTLPLDQDPTGGRRIFNMDFLIMGDALPDAALYHDPNPKKKLSTWFKGTFSRRAPQLIFRLANQEYIAADEPSIVLKRKTIAANELPRATFKAFVSGSISPPDPEGVEKLTVKKFVVLPASNAANAAIYRALLQE